MTWLAVFIGGGLGSLSRFAIGRWLGNHGTGFPLGTFLANLVACLLLALALVYFQHKGEAWNSAKLLVMVGFCGGFSTFSTFSLETIRLIQAGSWLLAIAYVVASIGICLLTLLLLIPKG